MSFSNANFTKLRDILNSNEYYNIPDYQRPYSWNPEQVDILLSDLLEDYQGQNANHYFCGSVVLLKPTDQDSRYDIIDGQQRLTTFILLLAVLKYMYADKMSKANQSQIQDSIWGRYGEGNRIKLKLMPDKAKYTDFDKTLQSLVRDEKNTSNEIIQDFKTVQKDKYWQSANAIKEYLLAEDEFKNIDINAFVTYLFEKIDFVVILVDGLDNAMKIFNVLNDRGLALKPSDILKSSLMAAIESDEQRTLFYEAWKRIYAKLNDDNELDKVLNYYTFYTITENPDQRYDKILISKFRHSNMVDKISEIERFADIYRQVVKEDNVRIHLLKYFKWNYCLPMAVIAKYVNYPKFNELLDILIAYYFQHLIAGHTLTKVKQTSFQIMKAIKNNKPLEDIKVMCKNNLDKDKTTELFKANLEGAVDTKKWIKPLLLMLEYNKYEEGRGRFIEINTKLHLEHILPQTIEEKDGTPTPWCKDFETKEKHEKFLRRLGNLTLLSLKKNEEIKNHDFSVKKEAYYSKNPSKTNSHITLNHEIAEYTTWCDKDIIDRENKLKERILKKLDIFQ